LQGRQILTQGGVGPGTQADVAELEKAETRRAGERHIRRQQAGKRRYRTIMVLAGMEDEEFDDC